MEDKIDSKGIEKEQEIDIDAILINAIEHMPNDAWSDKLDKYIRALSVFIYDSDTAYKYNVPFLVKKHERFKQFLKTGKNKYNILNSIVEDIISDTDIIKLSKINGVELTEFVFSVNDFIELKIGEKISLCKEFNIQGAYPVHEKSRVTILCNHKGARLVRTCSADNISEIKNM